MHIDELGQQVTRHDLEYLRRRSGVRRFLGHVGINLPELPDGHFHPRGGKIYPVLTQLEEQGVVRAEFEPPREDGNPSTRMYQLMDQASESAL